jgi:hypothetical protein
MTEPVEPKQRAFLGQVAIVLFVVGILGSLALGGLRADDWAVAFLMASEALALVFGVFGRKSLTGRLALGGIVVLAFVALINYVVFRVIRADMDRTFDDRRAAAPPSGPLALQVIYHEGSFMEGGNATAVAGVKEFIFRNTSSTKPLTIAMPPAEVHFLSSNSKQRLDKSDWPEFARTSASYTLPPDGQRVFTSTYSMDVMKSAKREDATSPNYRFVFGSPNSGSETPEGVFTGTITSESSWDYSHTAEVSSP